MSANAFFLLKACGEEAVGSTFRTCCPTVPPSHTRVLVYFESKRWNLEHVLDLFSHFTMGRIRAQRKKPRLLTSWWVRIRASCAGFVRSSSSSEVFDTATARRHVRVEDATRVGQQFSFRSERRGRGAPSIAIKWRDAVNAAIMHGPLLPDVTLDVPCWWQPGMPLLRPTRHISPVPPKRKRDMSAEPKTDQAVVRGLTRLSMCVSMARRTLTAFAGRSSWCRSSAGPWHPTQSADGMTAAHLTSAADRELSPFAFSRLAKLTHAFVARLCFNVHTWQHVYRRVLRELDIEF